MNPEGGVPSRTKGKSLLTDQQLELDGKNKDHERDQLLKNTITYLSIIALIGLTVFLFAMLAGLWIHYYLNGEFDKIEKAGFAIGGVALGYMVRYFQGRKILPEDK
jgi:hypothetical protein